MKFLISFNISMHNEIPKHWQQTVLFDNELISRNLYIEILQ